MEPASTIPDLASHTDFLRRLARRLIRDEHAAEDAVQDALVAALEKPPPFHGTPRAWFSAVVRNIGRMRARERGRRERRETAVARPDMTVPTADAVASLEIARRVVAELSSLDEPYRTVLVLRYYHDLRFAEIAARVGCPVATVRTRHHRALARLRDRLDERSRGHRRAWIMALHPLTEGVAMKKTGAGVLALLLLLLFLGFQWLLIRGDETREPPEPKDEVTIVAAEPPGQDAGAPEKPVEAVNPAARPETDGAHPPDGVAVLRVVDGMGRVVAGARVTLLEGPFDVDDYLAPRIVAEQTTRENGRVRFRVAPFRPYPVKVVHPDYAVSGDVFCWGGSVTEFPLRAAGTIHGVVRDASTGQPVVGANVWVMDWGGAGVTHEWITASDGNGRYRVGGVGRGKLNVRAWADGYADGVPTRDFTVVPAVEVRVDLVLTPGKPLFLRFLDADSGQPVPEVTVRFGPHPPITGPGTGFSTFVARPDWPATFVLRAEGYADRLLSIGRAELATPSVPLTVQLSKGVTVAGLVLRESGEPASGVTVRLWSESEGGSQLTIREIETRQDGTFESRFALPGGRMRFDVHGPGGGITKHEWQEVRDRSGVLRVGPVLLPETTVVTGRIVVPGGATFGGATVRVAGPPAAAARIDPRGRFRLTGVVPGTVELHLAGVRDYPTQALRVRAGAGGALVWRLPRGQEITGRVLDADGRPCPGEWVRAEPGGAESRTDESGRFRFRGLDAGNYRLALMNYRDPPVREVRGNTYDVVLRLPDR